MKLIFENWRKFINEDKKLSPDEAIDKEGGALGYSKWEELTGMSREELEKYVKDNDHIKVHKHGDIIDTGGLSEDLDLNEDYVFDEGKICAKGISYVIRTDPGGKDIKRGSDGKLKNWSARAAQIASKYCKDPNYGKGRGKDAKDESISLEEDCWDGYERVPGSKEGAPGSCRKKTNEAIVSEGEGGLKAWERENWTHSDGTPCGGGKKDGSKSRCKPASKWKTMSASEKAADNAKKSRGTKAGKQYVSATKKGKVTKSHTKRKG